MHYRLPAEQNPSEPITSDSVAKAMEQLIAEFQPDFKRQPAQRALYHALSRTWDTFGADLLHCYDIDGLPPDNLALEALFSNLRRHQRLISGHKSTAVLRVLGHYQVLFQAESQEELLAQMRTVPLDRYYHHRRLLEQAAKPRRFINRLHRDPAGAIQSLADAYKTRQRQLSANTKSLTAQLEHTS